MLIGGKETKRNMFVSSGKGQITVEVDHCSREDIDKLTTIFKTIDYHGWAFSCLSDCIIKLDRLEENVQSILKAENIGYLEPIEAIRDIRKRVNSVLDQMRGQNSISDVKYEKIRDFQQKLISLNKYIRGFLMGPYTFETEKFKKLLDTLRVCSLRI